MAKKAISKTWLKTSEALKYLELSPKSRNVLYKRWMESGGVIERNDKFGIRWGQESLDLYRSQTTN